MCVCSTAKYANSAHVHMQRQHDSYDTIITLQQMQWKWGRCPACYSVLYIVIICHHPWPLCYTFFPETTQKSWWPRSCRRLIATFNKASQILPKGATSSSCLRCASAGVPGAPMVELEVFREGIDVPNQNKFLIICPLVKGKWKMIQGESNQSGNFDDLDLAF